MLKKTFSFFFKKHPRKTGAGLIVILLLYVFCLPSPLFDDPTCMVLEDKDGKLLGARIAADGQWRFPYSDAVPDKFVKAIVEFEDKRFFSHWGVDPLGLARAFRQNIQQRKIVSGGSTLTMQVMRISRKGKPRTVFQKLIETIQATRLEFKYSKNEILALYASHAPFGGNVVGLEAASWRYYAKSPAYLSWAEAATLAVLPNSPALIHPGRNRDQLLAKRNRLLKRLFEKNYFDQTSYELALEEALPQKPIPLPRLAPHLLERAYAENFKNKKNKITRIQSTLDENLQIRANRILKRHHQHLVSNGIHNAAAIIVEVSTGNVLAYVGNIIDAGKEHGQAVDVIPAPRSTGSILKPFLYAMMIQEGQLLPNTLIPDVPTYLSGYRPVNFHETYDGVVSAKRALIRSLNVPFIRMLQKYGLEKFHFGLKQLGFSHIRDEAQHYGLPLVLGGAEASLWDITSAYTSMARGLKNIYELDGKYNPSDLKPLNYNNAFTKPKIEKTQFIKEAPGISASASWLAFKAMKNVERPNSEGHWGYFNSSRPMAWKTGTSFGFRDAWAVGVTTDYAIGVWAGNADGEGRPGLIGVVAAAPILFDLAKEVPHSEWFDPPYDEMTNLSICKKSGYRALDICPKDSVWAPLSAIDLKPCAFHKLIHLNKDHTWQVNSDCEPPHEIQHEPWFVLPPLEEFYYKSKDPTYKLVPPLRPDCLNTSNTDQKVMQMIYPRFKTSIYIPIDLDGEESRTVFKVAHRDDQATIYWHLNQEYIGQTQSFHHFELNPPFGKHQLTLVDDKGNRLEMDFEVVGKEE